MKLVSSILIIVGFIHLIPLKGISGADAISKLYGVAVNTKDLELLLVHRTVLFGILGVFLILGAFNSIYQPAAVAAGLISTFSFIVISRVLGQENDLLHRVVLVDWVASILLLIAGAILIYHRLK